jgi:hypothetical protein
MYRKMRRVLPPTPSRRRLPDLPLKEKALQRYVPGETFRDAWWQRTTDQTTNFSYPNSSAAGSEYRDQDDALFSDQDIALFSPQRLLDVCEGPEFFTTNDYPLDDIAWKLSRAVYEPITKIAGWLGPAFNEPVSVTAYAGLPKSMSQPSSVYKYSIIQNRQHGTQVLVATLRPNIHSNPLVIVAFRGTENMTNIRTDIRSVPDSSILFSDGENDLVGHLGFNLAYLSIRNEVLRAIHDHGSVFTTTICPILVTGHSMGGSMAHYCAYDILSNFRYGERCTSHPFGADPCAAVPPQVALITFASPYVFLEKHTNVLNRLLLQQTPDIEMNERYLIRRHAHAEDMVTNLRMPMVGFTHLGPALDVSACKTNTPWWKLWSKDYYFCHKMISYLLNPKDLDARTVLEDDTVIDFTAPDEPEGPWDLRVYHSDTHSGPFRGQRWQVWQCGPQNFNYQVLVCDEKEPPIDAYNVPPNPDETGYESYFDNAHVAYPRPHDRDAFLLHFD